MVINNNNTIVIIFAYLGFLIGAGVATGQEILQFYTANSNYMFGVGFIIVVILCASNFCYSYATVKSNDDSPFIFYFGNKIGNIIDWFCTIFCFFTYVIMISGASTTLQQQYSFPKEIGVLIISVLVFITILFGLKRFVKILAYVTPVIVIIVIAISCINIFNNIINIPNNIVSINNGSFELTKAGHTWWLSGISNGGFCLLMLSKFTVRLCKTTKIEIVNLASLMSSIILVVINIIIGFSLLTKIDVIYNIQIPNLYIFSEISSLLGLVFGVFIFLALYTSACPLIWSVVIKVSNDEMNRKYLLVCFVFSLIGFVATMIFDFSWLINHAYTYCGYLGFVILLFMLGRLFYLRTKSKLQ